MRILITGANGFLGQRTVAAFRARYPSDTVQVMVRPSTDAAKLSAWSKDNGIEVVRADLRNPERLKPLIGGQDVVVHLAAVVRGSDEEMLEGTVRGTEHLLAAMNHASIKRLVLCSSFSVYDYRKIPVGGILDESAPLIEQPDIYQRNGYTIAKTWQERLVRRWAESQQGQLTVLRPGFIWGPRHAEQPFQSRVGPIHTVLGPDRHLALSFVDNCADAFAHVTMDSRAHGETFHVVDEEDITAAAYTAAFVSAQKQRNFVIPLPYAFGYQTALAADAVRRLIGKGRLPSILNPYRFEPRFKPIKVAKDKLSRVLDWKQPISYDEALQRTYNQDL